MWNLGEYRKHAQRLADHLPWAALVAPGVVLNKDGSLQRTVVFRGPDLESSTPHELVAARARMNNALRRFGSRWCLHIEACRRKALSYPNSSFPNPVAKLIDDERRSMFGGGDSGFESEYHLTLTYLPPDEQASRIADLLVEHGNATRRSADYAAYLEGFLGQVQQIANLLRGFMPEVRMLDDAETLTYLHGCVSDRRIRVAVPDTPFYLDELLTDRPFTGGLSPRLGSVHLKTIGIRAFIGRTLPCLLDALNELPIEYRWVARWLPMDKTDAANHLGKLRRQWFAKRKGVWSLLKEAITKQESALEDSDSLNKAQDVDDALQELGGDHCSFGQLTLTVTVSDVNEYAATEKARLARQVIDSTGIVSEIEDFNAVQAWLGSLPGHAYANVRRPIVSSLNLCDLIPLSSVWSGAAWNRHLNGPALIQTRTHGSTPFRLSLHQGDVGHALVAGPTGAGKSTLLNLITCQWLRYPNGRVYIFDKGGSCRAVTLAMGGNHYDIGGDNARICFQPLAGIENDAEVAWATEWAGDLLKREGVELTPALKQELWSALSNLRSMPARQRTLSTLHNLAQDPQVRQALRHYTLDGPWGQLLDADHDTLADGARWQAFEMQHLMQTRAAVVPVLTYLFHRLEKRFDGSPTLIVLDEAWLYLTESYFAAKVREWLKVLRKQNVAVVFATQSLSDIADSPIAPAIVENCLTRIFLPNAAAMEERTRRIYESFGLNERQLAILQQAIPKRDYYYQSREGNRLFELGLGPIQLALCAAGTPEDLARIDRVLAAFGTEQFAGHYFDALELHNGAINQAFSQFQQDERKQHEHDMESGSVAEAPLA
jgi:type IV secretion system protein VirB4